MKRFEKDLNLLVKNLSQGENQHVINEIRRLGEYLVSLNRRNLVKINHSVMELVCAKFLIRRGFHVNLERELDEISCDIHAVKDYGSLIVEVETGFIPPKHALDPFSYLIARISSKITRYSGYSEKFGLAIPFHYNVPILPALVKSPRERNKQEMDQIRSLCDLYYSKPPVSLEEIMNARIHTIFILEVDHGEVIETEPVSYINEKRLSKKRRNIVKEHI